MNFDDVRPPGTLHITVTDENSGDGLDASISIKSGIKPLIGFFGSSRFFTELDEVGEITQVIAPGDYVLEISAGAGFTAKPQLVEVLVEPGESKELSSIIAVTAAPQEHGWYSADLHHHSDVLDGFTEAEYVFRSELASGIDISFLSDHDHHPTSICRHPQTEDAAEGFETAGMTAASIVAEPAQRRMHVSLGNPCENAFATYSMDEN